MNFTHSLTFAALAAGGLALGAVLDKTLDQGRLIRAGGDQTYEEASVAPSRPERPAPLYDYELLRQRITYGQASLADARRAMTDRDPVSLTNTIHALYTMRHHRGVIHLLDGMWRIDTDKYPKISWDLVAKPPARIALASTINRVKIIRTEPFQAYIRTYRDHEREFIRAQVVVALGFNGDPIDLPYLRSMADGDNHYVAQSAITGLSIFGGPQARQVLIDLQEKYRGTSRGDLMAEMLRRAYDWTPPST